MYRVSATEYWLSLTGYLLFVLIIFYYGLRKKTPVRNSQHLKWIFACMILLGVYSAFTGDYPHYAVIVSNVYHHSKYLTHFEEIYVNIVHFFNGDYTLFRLTVYSISFISLYYVLKATQCLDIRILLLYTCLELQAAIEGRQQCSYNIFYLGIALLLLKRKYILGIVFVFLSTLLHKSGIISFALLPFLFFRFNKRNILISFILFPFVVYLKNMVLMEILSDDSTEIAGSSYFNSEDFSRTIYMKICYYGVIWIQYALGIITLYKCLKSRFVADTNIWAPLLFGCMYISSALFFLDIEQSTPFYRSLRLWWLPMLFLMGKFINPSITKNKKIFLLSVCYITLNLLYLVLVYRYQPNYYE